MGFRSKLKGRIKKIIGGGSGGGAAKSMREALATLPTEPDSEDYYAVATADLIKDGTGNTFVRNGHGVAVFRVDGKLYAIDDACTHEDGPLGEGEVNGTVVTCPYHDWRFDMNSGECLSHENRHVSCYAVREKDGFVWVGPRTRGGYDERGGLHDDGHAVRPRRRREGPRGQQF